MNLRSVLFFFTVFTVFALFPLMAREKSDVIVMKNGDKITCEVKGLSSNTLFISVDYILNTLSVDWTKVDHIDSKQLFLVKTQDGTVFTGSLSTPESPAGRPLQIEVVEARQKTVTLERKQVVTVDETSSSFWQRWNGQVGLGSSYTKGNESAQYNLNSNINYVVERWSAGASYSSNLSSSTGAAVSTRNQLSTNNFSVDRKTTFPRYLRSAPDFCHPLIIRLIVCGATFTELASSSFVTSSSTPPGT
jgi:hypothetical protein